MKTYSKLPAIIGILGASALATNLGGAVARPPAEKIQVGQLYDDSERGAETSDLRHVKSERK